jgi:hypothetical protein
MFGITHKKQNGADPRIAAALEEAEVKYQIDDDGDYHVSFELENGRSQTAIIRSRTFEFLGVEIREIFSAGLLSNGPFDARTANILLQQNEVVKLGAWGVLKNDEDAHAAVFTAKISTDLPTAEMLGVLTAVITTADEMEARLSGRDDF